MQSEYTIISFRWIQPSSPCIVERFLPARFEPVTTQSSLLPFELHTPHLCMWIVGEEFYLGWRGQRRWRPQHSGWSTPISRYPLRTAAAAQKNSHCPNKKSESNIKTEAVTAEADKTVHVRLLYINIRPRNQTYIVASAPTGTGSVFMRRFLLYYIGTVLRQSHENEKG